MSEIKQNIDHYTKLLSSKDYLPTFSAIARADTAALKVETEVAANIAALASAGRERSDTVTAKALNRLTKVAIEIGSTNPAKAAMKAKLVALFQKTRPNEIMGISEDRAARWCAAVFHRGTQEKLTEGTTAGDEIKVSEIEENAEKHGLQGLTARKRFRDETRTKAPVNKLPPPAPATNKIVVRCSNIIEDATGRKISTIARNAICKAVGAEGLAA